MKLRTIVLYLVLTPLLFRAANNNLPCYESRSSSFAKFLTWTDEKTQIAKFIVTTISQGSNNLSLLDIGAGNGLLTKQIAHLFDEITAIEPSLYLFKELQTKCCEAKFTCINAPFEETNLAKQFDVILISFALQYIPNYETELRRIKQLLKPTGMVIITEIEPENNELYLFYRSHVATVLGYQIPEPTFVFFDDVLKQHFTVTKSSIQTKTIIPSIQKTLEIANFIFDTDWPSFQKDALTYLQDALIKTYGENNPVTFSSPVTAFVCTKEN